MYCSVVKAGMFADFTEPTRQPGKRRKRKSSTGNAAGNLNSGGGPTKKRSPGPQGIGSSVPGVSLISRVICCNLLEFNILQAFSLGKFISYGRGLAVQQQKSP